MLAKRSSEKSVAKKIFVRSTKSGNAIKIFREQYLRDDIPCGSPTCTECLAKTEADANGNILPPVLHAEPPEGALLVLDTNVVLRGIDLLEHPEAFVDVIIPQVVLEEVRHRSLPTFMRLRALTATPGSAKRFYVYHNEFSKSTYIPREPNVTVNDWNDQKIRMVAQYYAKHLPNIPVVLVTNDRANSELAREAGGNVEVATLREFIVSRHPNLVDLVPEVETRAPKVETSYPPYISVSKVLGGVKSGSLRQGKLSVSRYNYLEATVGDVLIAGHENINRAFDGDIVAVEVLPEAEWQAPSAEFVTDATVGGDDDSGDEEASPNVDEAELAANVESKKERKRVTGRVVAVVKRNWRFYVGHVAPESVAGGDGPQRSVLIQPLDRRIPRIRLRTRRARSLTGQRLVVAVDDWPVWSSRPEGHLVRELGAIESHEAETESILLEHDIEYRPFPAAALACLPEPGWLPTMDDPKRRDLRDLLICSIDPPNCQDIDDALHARRLSNGNYHVGVHIADVTHFVNAGTPLDSEGASRGTSTYLVDRRIDMLPALLGTDLCSLRGGVERFAFSVLWEMTPDAKIVNVEFTKSLIRSRRAFEYEEAQACIDSDAKDDLTEGMRILLRLSQLLRQQRLDAGALNLASPEVKVLTDSETSDPQDVEVKKAVPTNSLVEEFMLLANISVARKIYDSYPQTAMLRRHGAPPSTNFDDLNDQLRQRGFPIIDTSSSKAVADSLDQIVDPNDTFFNTLVRIMATRCMLAAEYFSSGALPYSEFRHYGLATDIYTHFTSPIRRYADVVVHRQLAGAIGYKPYSPTNLEPVCENINMRHRNAQLAGRASIEYFVGQILKEKDSVQEAHVVRVFGNGIGVLVPRYGLESIIKLADLVNDVTKVLLDEDTYTLHLDEHRKVTVFDKVNVLVQSVKDERTGKRYVKMTLA